MLDIGMFFGDDVKQDQWVNASVHEQLLWRLCDCAVLRCRMTRHMRHDLLYRFFVA